MSEQLFSPHRYQINKWSTLALQQGHPWVFRGNLSSASKIFSSGQQLSLLDGQNQFRGFGIYDAEGLIGIRVYSYESDQPISQEFLSKRILKAYQKRLVLGLRTNAFRVIHGEADRLPGITLDLYNRHGVLQLYTTSLIPWVNDLAAAIQETLPIDSLRLRVPRRLQGTPYQNQMLFGESPDEVEIKENEDRFLVPLAVGQKGGMFLDLRPVRDLIRNEIRGKRMLNLFSNTCSASVVAKNVGFSETVNIDLDEKGLAVGQRMLGEGHQFIKADLFDGIPAEVSPPFDFILIDPPSLGSQKQQLPVVKHALEKLVTQAIPLLSTHGTFILCSCTKNITKKILENLVKEIASKSKMKLSTNGGIPPAEDHPILSVFPEGIYWSGVRFQKGL